MRDAKFGSHSQAPDRRMTFAGGLTRGLAYGAFVSSLACAPAVQNSGAHGTADPITRLERARADHPTDEGVLRSLGIAYYKTGRLGDARLRLREATRLDPNDGVAALYLGLAAEGQEDLAAARDAYTAYLETGKTKSARDQVRARLAALARLEIRLAAKQAVAGEARLAATPAQPNAVAVLPFAFSGSDTTLKPLERGMAELVTTDLSRSSKLVVLDRFRVQALLDELALQNHGMVDTTTGVRAGRILHAGRLVLGHLDQSGQELRAVAGIADASTGRVADGGSDNGAIEQLFRVENDLVLQLFDHLHVTLTTAERDAIERRPTRSIVAFLAFSRGLEAEDEGRFDDASRFFDNAVRIDPGFGAAQQKSQETHTLTVGAQFSAATVENALQSTREGAAVAATSGGSDANSQAMASQTADGLNPSSSAAATEGTSTTTTTTSTTAAPPQTKDPLAGTGTNNPSQVTPKISIAITIPKP